MRRSRLKNIANKSINPEDWVAYRRQRNLVVNMNRHAKKTFLAGTITSSKAFWKKVKPFFSSKHITDSERILLVENDDFIADEDHIATIFNEYFNSITDGLKIPNIPSVQVTGFLDPVSIAISKYASHPSILKIKSITLGSKPFEFKEVARETVLKEINNLNSAKSVSGPIPVKALKAANSVIADILTACFNHHVVSQSEFPDELKLADIIPVFKKGNAYDKSNYRPISLLPVLSKVFEKLITKQFNPFIEHWFSKNLCGFRKGYSTQHALLNMFRKWQRHLNTSGRIGAILMDLSKAFNCLPHDLLIAKLAAYGVGRKALCLFYSYLRNRKHRVRIGSSFSKFLELLIGVPQGSVLGPVLFNVFINDLLLSETESDICNFADDDTIHVCRPTIEGVVNQLKIDLDIVISWFEFNGMVANPAKFQMIFPGNDINISLKIGPHTITSSKEVKLLGITIDCQLTFYPHIQTLCKTVLSKTKALWRIRSFLTQHQADVIFHTCLMSYFNYCPLVWMFSNKRAHNLINLTHRRALCARLHTYSGKLSELSEKTKSLTIHKRNLQLMVIEVFKSVNRIGPVIICKRIPHTFNIRDVPYELRQGHSIVNARAFKTQTLNSFDFRASLAWNKLPGNLKTLESIAEFKTRISKLTIYCRCKNCI